MSKLRQLAVVCWIVVYQITPLWISEEIYCWIVVYQIITLWIPEEL